MRGERVCRHVETAGDFPRGQAFRSGRYEQSERVQPRFLCEGSESMNGIY